MAERRTPKSSAASPGFAVPEPSPAARELLRAFRQHESPSARAREHGFSALRARLALESAANGGPKPTPAANGRLYGIARATLVTVAVAAAVLLAIKAVGSGVSALADRARQPALEAPYQGEVGSDGGQAVSRAPRILPPRRGDDGAAEASAGHGAPALEPAAPAPAEATKAHRGEPSREAESPTGTRSPRPRASASSDASGLEEELALIKRATEAKKAGRHAEGLAALREHAQRFPRGVLADERMVLKAELHCAAGRVGEADALVESFLRERAGSALAGRMRNVCRE